MSNELDEHLNMIKYFHKEKGDMTQYCEFEKIKPTLKEKYPHLLKALEDYNNAEKILNIVVESL